MTLDSPRARHFLRKTTTNAHPVPPSSARNGEFARPCAASRSAAEQLDAQLDNQVDLWLSGPHGLQIDRAPTPWRISKIFEWFAEGTGNRTTKTDRCSAEPQAKRRAQFHSANTAPPARTASTSTTPPFTASPTIDYETGP